MALSGSSPTIKEDANTIRAMTSDCTPVLDEASDQCDLLWLANSATWGNWRWVEGQRVNESDVSHPDAPTNPSPLNVMSVRHMDLIVFQLRELAWSI